MRCGVDSRFRVNIFVFLQSQLLLCSTDIEYGEWNSLASAAGVSSHIAESVDIGSL